MYGSKHIGKTQIHKYVIWFHKMILSRSSVKQLSKIEKQAKHAIILYVLLQNNSGQSMGQINTWIH